MRDVAPCCPPSRIVTPPPAEIHSRMEASTIIQALAEPERMEPFVIVEAAAPHKIVASNKPFCALTGFASEELVARSVAMLHGPLSCCETLAALGLAMNGTRRPFIEPRLCKSVSALDTWKQWFLSLTSENCPSRLLMRCILRSWQAAPCGARLVLKGIRGVPGKRQLCAAPGCSR